MAAILSKLKRTWKAYFSWWAVLLGLLFFALNGCFYFQSVLADSLGWMFPFQDNFLLQSLLYLLLSFLCVFIVVVLRGDTARQANAAIHMIVLAMYIGIIPVFLLSETVGFLISFAGAFQFVRDFLSTIQEHHPLDDLAGVEFLIDGFIFPPIFGCSQVFIGLAGIKVGELLRRLLHQRPRPEKAIPS